MCLLRYRRLPTAIYRIRYGDPGGEILPLFWLGGCVLCLWVSLFATVIVSLLARDLLAGLAVGLGGALLGVIATTALAVGFPGIDARWLRLGPLAVLIELSTLVVGAAVVVLLGLVVLLGCPANVVDTAQVTVEAARPGAGFDLLAVSRRLVPVLFVAGVIVSALGLLPRRR